MKWSDLLESLNVPVSLMYLLTVIVEVILLMQRTLNRVTCSRPWLAVEM